MGEELDERWLQQHKGAVPVGCEVHPMERMLFRCPKVTFASRSNVAFEDAFDIRVAITAERFWPWWAKNRDSVRYVSYAGESLMQLVASVRMIMSLDGVDIMIMYRPAAESEGLTTLYEKDHIEETLPGLEAVYLTCRPFKICGGA